VALRRVAAAVLIAACGGDEMATAGPSTGTTGGTTGTTGEVSGGTTGATGEPTSGASDGSTGAAVTSTGEATGGTTGDPGLDPDAPPVVEGEWYRPGLSATWQYQLTAALVTVPGVEIYDIDLFDSDAAVIAGLHAEGARALCYFSAGSGEDWRPDYGDIDAAALGEPLDGWPGERWLDYRHPSVQKVMLGRLELARDKGCDGVEADNVDGHTQASGFELSATDQLAYNRWLANRAHERGLAVALKNDLEQVAELVSYFDLEVNEQCWEYEECDLLQPFVAAGKPALVVEYPGDQAAAEALAGTLCPEALAAELRTIILPLELDGSWRVACD
jgi:hypothetical protein